MERKISDQLAFIYTCIHSSVFSEIRAGGMTNVIFVPRMVSLEKFSHVTTIEWMTYRFVNYDLNESD